MGTTIMSCGAGGCGSLTDEQLRKLLSPEQYRIARERGTERAFTGKYYDHHERGTYICVCCKTELFSSSTKYDSGSGWPSFYAAMHNEANVGRKLDTSHGMQRVEVVCKKCDAHLGHVFDDGPAPTGERFCINSASLDFLPANKKS